MPGDNLVQRRDDGCFQRRAIRRRREGPVDPADRRVKKVEALVGNLSGDFSAEAARGECLVDDEQSASFADRFQDRRRVERRDRSGVDDFDRDAFGRQLTGRGERLCAISAMPTTVIWLPSRRIRALPNSIS